MALAEAMIYGARLLPAAASHSYGARRASRPLLERSTPHDDLRVLGAIKGEKVYTRGVLARGEVWRITVAHSKLLYLCKKKITRKINSLESFVIFLTIVKAVGQRSMFV